MKKYICFSDSELEEEKKILQDQKRVLIRKIDSLDTEIIAIKETILDRKAERAWEEQLVGKNFRS